MGFFSKIWKKLTGWLKPDIEQNKGFELEKQGTNQNIPVIYGKYPKAPSIKVFKMSSDKSGGAWNEYLHFICIICEGEIGRFGNVYFDGISETAINNERYYIEKYTGSDTQTHSAELSRQLSMWKSTADLNGLAYLYVRLHQNKNVDWWRGEPKITVDVDQGKLITDLRDGQLKYSNNLPLCTYDFLTNPRYGKGLPAAELNQQHYIDEANYTETQRTYTSTVYKREWDPETRTWIKYSTGTENVTVNENLFSCNVSLDTDKTIKENVDILLKGARAILPESQGQYKYVIEKEADVAFAFTLSDLSGAVISDGGSQDKRYNQVIIKYRNKLTATMDEVFYPESDALHQQWLAEDKGKLLLGEFKVETIDNKAEALQMAQVIARRSRQDIRAQWLGMPWTIKIESGDVISLPSKINGWTAKPFRVESVEPDLDTGLVKFQGVEHQNTIYPWSVTETTEEYTDTSFYLPSDIVSPTGLYFAGAADDSNLLGVLAWTDPNDAMVVSHYVEVIDTDSDAVVFSQETTQHRIEIPRFALGSYSASVYAQNSLSISAPTVINLVASAPKVPNGLTISPGNFELILTPTIDGSPGTLLFDLKVSADTDIANATVLGRARSFTDNNLASNTSRYYWARSINSTGESAWSEMFTGKTTNDNTRLVEFLSDLGPANFATEVREVLDQVSDIEKIRTDLDAAENAISNVRIDEASIVDLQSTYQQLGIDLLSSQGDNNSAFSAMIEKLADTDQFVLDINEQLGQILVDGGKVSYEQFVNYKLLVDTLNGSLSSIINQVTSSESGLKAAHSKIDQNIEKIELVLGNTNTAELFTLAKQVSVNLDRLTNTITQQSFALKFDEWAQFQQTLSGELQLSELLENNIDFAISQEKTASNVDEVKAEASSTKLLVTSFNEELRKATSTFATNEHVLSTAKRTEAKVTKQLRSEISDETSARESAIKQTQQTLVDETSAWAMEINSLKSTINDPQTGLEKAHSEITDTRQTLGNEINGISDATAALKARVVNEEQKSASAIIVLNAHNEAIGELKGKVFLGLDIDGRVSGLLIEGNETLTEIDIAADKISFVNPETDEKDLSYNAAKKRLEFGGALKVGTLIQSPKIEYVGATHMRISSATGFGSNNQFIEWFGLNIMSGGGINYAALNESNAITYLKTDGDAYFGGSIISGSLSNSLTTSSLSRSAEIEIGPYGSNGGTIAINCSISMGSNYSKFQTGTVSAPSAPSCTIVLEEFVGADWLTRQSASYEGTSSASNEYEGNGQYVAKASQQLSGSFTYTDNKNTIADRRYRVRIATRTNLLTLGDWVARQRLSINSQEE